MTVTDSLGRAITITASADGATIDYHVVGSGAGWAQDFVATFPAATAQDDAIANLQETTIPSPLVPTPPVPVAQSVTRYQIIAALSQTPSPVPGNASLLVDVQAAVTAAGGLTALAWQNAASFDRNGVFATQIGPAVGLNSAQLDTLFIAAAQFVG